MTERNILMPSGHGRSKSMRPEGYRPRLIDAKAERMLAAFGAVCIEGPKWCGKTWTSLTQANSAVFIGDPSNHFSNRELARLDVNSILAGKRPRLIDEWQEVPSIWDAVRFAVDQSGEKGQFILTGSATPRYKGVLHSGAGRIGTVRMRPMSLFESGESTGQVPLMDLFGERIPTLKTQAVSINDLIYYTVRGGWPAALSLERDLVSEIPRNYLNAVVRQDIARLDGIQRDQSKVNQLLRSLARNESTTASQTTLQRDMQANEIQPADLNTIAAYLDVLDRLFLIENQPPFSSNIRSTVRIRQREKRHFSDPSLACAALGLNGDMLLRDLETFGFMFEALCERDLRIYADVQNAKLYHYQDYKNREIDAIVELPDGRWGAFEIKLGAHQIDQAAENLLAIKADLAATPGAHMPGALVVICGTGGAAYTRADGVHVVPITALGP